MRVSRSINLGFSKLTYQAKVQLMFLAGLLALSTQACGDTVALHGTGFDLSGNPLTSGSIDRNWSLSGGFSGSNQAFFIAPGNPDWWPGGYGQPEYAANTNAATFNGSGWISNNASSNYNGPAPYTFSMQFDLSAFNLNTVSIVGQWAIGNGGTLDVNGHLVSNLPGLVNSNWGSLNAFSMTNAIWLNPGLNSINLTITNANGQYEAARFEGSVTGITTSVVPIPAAVWLFSSSLVGLGFLAKGSAKRTSA